jgi:23S rRNA (guanine745-N1)-methyltransferase
MMVAARGRFLNAGHYQAISDAVNRQAQQLIQDNVSSRVTIIDAGCGEGYYGARLQEHLNRQNIDTDIVGVDISKFACRAAAKRGHSIEWLVASNADLPVADRSADLLLCLFSPIQGPEFKRCLNSGGKLVVASTGQRHLLELRKILYDTVDASTINPTRVLAGRFSCVPQSRANIRYRIELEDNDSIRDLLAMTPHYWRASAERKNRLSNRDHLTVSVDVRVNGYSV